MTGYEILLEKARERNLSVKEKYLKSNSDGLIMGHKIALNKNKLQTARQKKCVLAEELAHFELSVGRIIELNDASNRKQELKARLRAYNNQIGLLGIIAAYKAGSRNLHDMADYLDVTEEFLHEALQLYKSKFGLCKATDNYIIYFEPCLGVVELLP